ncbi:fibrobacter succinogenes major paralogous domain-containing protein [uncultured Fibrobacter sp.]|uniref:fibrobacter succinogenes major paralogous domain-containing protein n=1 Tax=uncultured Fibrobacter sp. TaxID=261512 RepID=UPI0025DB9BA3|nr:fibrobacter succinogenes major paralogous domain-containing protein [uncultured Fibrobacter sp.]
MRISLHTSLAIASLAFLLMSCSESFTDSRDEQSYDVVKIDNLTWMAENLNYETETSACPDGDLRNCKRLGRLYTWAEAKTVCPEGWRLPTKSDFAQILAQSLDGNPGAVSNKVGAALKARDGWFKKGNGSDALGFRALPAGYRSADGKFDGIGGYAYFWSATEDAENRESNAFYLFLSFSSDVASINAFAKEDYRSVRCVTP